MDRCNCCNMPFGVAQRRNRTERYGFEGECCNSCNHRIYRYNKQGYEGWILGVRTGRDGKPVRCEPYRVNSNCGRCGEPMDGFGLDCRMLGVNLMCCAACHAIITEESRTKKAASCFVMPCASCNNPGGPIGGNKIGPARVKLGTITRHDPVIHALAVSAGVDKMKVCTTCYKRMRADRDARVAHWCHGLAHANHAPPKARRTDARDAKIRAAIEEIQATGELPTRKAISMKSGVSIASVNRFVAIHPEFEIAKPVDPSELRKQEETEQIQSIVNKMMMNGQPVDARTIAPMANLNKIRVQLVLDAIGVSGERDDATPSPKDIEDRVRFYRDQAERGGEIRFHESPWAREYRRKEWA